MAKNGGNKGKDTEEKRGDPVFVRPRVSTIDRIINLIDDCLGAEDGKDD